jgi:hypothetical protein
LLLVNRSLILWLWENKYKAVGIKNNNKLIVISEFNKFGINGGLWNIFKLKQRNMLAIYLIGQLVILKLTNGKTLK